jgi:hypothetical protein
MKHRREGTAALWLLACCLMTSRPAIAQSSQPLQLGVGYQFLHESVDRGGVSFPLGAYASIEHAITADQEKAWHWVGQFEAGVRRDSGFSEQLYTVLGGIRLASAKPLRWTPSGFGLIGLGTQNASCDDFCAGTRNGVALQGGFALTSPIIDSARIDIAFKATKLRVNGTGVFNAALAAGVRFSIGK